MAIEIVDFPIKNDDFPWQNVSSPEDKHENKHLLELLHDTCSISDLDVSMIFGGTGLQSAHQFVRPKVFPVLSWPHIHDPMTQWIHGPLVVIRTIPSWQWVLWNHFPVTSTLHHPKNWEIPAFWAISGTTSNKNSKLCWNMINSSFRCLNSQFISTANCSTVFFSICPAVLLTAADGSSVGHQIEAQATWWDLKPENRHQKFFGNPWLWQF